MRATYDLPHLCAVHRRIFGDIYDWAGQVRCHCEGKPVLPAQYIEPSAVEIFRQLRTQNFLRLESHAFSTG